MRSAIHTAIRVMTAAVLTVAVTFYCHASEHSRRFPVELQVLAANAADLLSSSLSVRYRRGLALRMAGSLGSLRFLAREYLEAMHRPDDGLLQRIDRLRRAYNRDDWQSLAKESNRLAGEYPVALAGLRPADAGPREIDAGRHIYRHLCMGCHEHPDTTQAIPAPNLFTMVRSQPPREYISRLIAGVHGTPAVALRNPFTDQEIAGLAAYLRQTTPPRSSR